MQKKNAYLLTSDTRAIDGHGQRFLLAAASNPSPFNYRN
jgi:hypothetical protein